jgi:hypothetical protein
MFIKMINVSSVVWIMCPHHILGLDAPIRRTEFINSVIVLNGLIIVDDDYVASVCLIWAKRHKGLLNLEELLNYQVLIPVYFYPFPSHFKVEQCL